MQARSTILICPSNFFQTRLKILKGQWNSSKEGSAYNSVSSTEEDPNVGDS